MALTELERAVIEAARAYVAEDPMGLIERNGDGFAVNLKRAIDALDAGQDPEIQEIGWHEVAEGDQLRSTKTGKFYEVLGNDKKWDGTRRIGVKMPSQVQLITRPTEAEPTAFVKRGQAGKAVAVFVEVFSSGEAT